MQSSMDKFEAKSDRDNKEIKGQNEGPWKLIQLNQNNFVGKESF